MWDKKTPKQNESISKGDDRIRELKNDLENAFITEFGQEFLFGKHDFINLPELYLPNQIKLREYATSGLYTLDIFLNNQWNKGTQLVDFNLNSIMPSCSTESFFGWQTISLETSYMLVLGNILITENYGFKLDEDILHHHGDENKKTSTEILQHTHTSITAVSIADKDTEINVNYGNLTGKVWTKNHTHDVKISINFFSSGHNHVVSEVNVGNFNTFFCKLIRKVL